MWYEESYLVPKILRIKYVFCVLIHVLFAGIWSVHPLSMVLAFSIYSCASDFIKQISSHI